MVCSACGATSPRNSSEEKGAKAMWDLIKTLAIGAILGLAIRATLDLFSALSKSDDSLKAGD